MQLHSTSDPAEFDTAVADYFAARPVVANVPATAVAALLTGRPGGGEPDPVFLWCTDDADGVVCAATWTPPHAVYVVDEPVEPFVEALVGTAPPGAVGMTGPVTAFVRRWAEATGASHRLRLRELAYRLDRLVDPPVPPGRARVLGPDDAAVVERLLDAFVAEAGVRGRPTGPPLLDRLAAGRFTVWEDRGGAVALAGRSPAVNGVARIGPVYTTPAGRGRGYGRAVTATVCRQAFESGASAVMLFADVTNPVSNAIYRQLGFRPQGCLEEYDFGTVASGG